MIHTTISAGPGEQVLGKTYHHGLDVPALADAGPTIQKEGQGRLFPNLDPDNIASITGQKRDSLLRVFVLARNVHSAAVAPKTVIKWTDGFFGRRFVPCGADELFGGVVDELLPVAGCRVNDLCWVCISGPTLALKVSGDTYAVGDFVNTHASGALGTNGVSGSTTVDNDGSHGGMALVAAAPGTTEALVHLNPIHQ